MFSKKDLLESFSTVEEGPGGRYFFQHKLPKVTYQYYLKTSVKIDFIAVSEDATDRDFSTVFLDQAPSLIEEKKPTIYEIQENDYGFTHAIAVPSSYHSILKGRLEDKRKNLYLCIPIFCCEFSGEESEEEFKEMITRMVPVFKWRRSSFPKLRVYFDNPKTGAGTYENGTLMKFETLVSEMESLSGVVSGFIEVTNFKGEVLEVLSPAQDVYIVIRNRIEEESFNFSKALDEVSGFSGR